MSKTRPRRRSLLVNLVAECQKRASAAVVKAAAPLTPPTSNSTQHLGTTSAGRVTHAALRAGAGVSTALRKTPAWDELQAPGPAAA